MSSLCVGLAGRGPCKRRLDCAPGYYNNEGGELSAHSLFGGYVHGGAAYFRYIEQWRQAGDFGGLRFTKQLAPRC